MSSRGNPYFMKGLKERQEELLKRLRENGKDDWPKILARFAFDFGVRREKVEEYFDLIMAAGLLEVEE